MHNLLQLHLEGLYFSDKVGHLLLSLDPQLSIVMVGVFDSTQSVLNFESQIDLVSHVFLQFLDVLIQLSNFGFQVPDLVLVRALHFLSAVDLLGETFISALADVSDERLGRGLQAVLHQVLVGHPHRLEHPGLLLCFHAFQTRLEQAVNCR